MPDTAQMGDSSIQTGYRQQQKIRTNSKTKRRALENNRTNKQANIRSDRMKKLFESESKSMIFAETQKNLLTECRNS